jgi:hypothetical protein
LVGTGERSIKDVYKGLGAGMLSTSDLTALDEEDRAMFEVAPVEGTETYSITTTQNKKSYGFMLLGICGVLLLLNVMK